MPQKIVKIITNFCLKLKSAYNGGVVLYSDNTQEKCRQFKLWQCK